MRTAPQEWKVWPGVLLIGVAIFQLIGVYLHYRNDRSPGWLLLLQVICEVGLAGIGVYCIYRAKARR